MPTMLRLIFILILGFSGLQREGYAHDGHFTIAAEKGFAAGTDSISAMRRSVYEAADYHGKVGNPVKSAAPRNGQEVLDMASQLKSTSPRRIGVDATNGEIVIFDQTTPGVFHGHVRTWDQLTQEMKNVLIDRGDFTRRGVWVPPPQ